MNKTTNQLFIKSFFILFVLFSFNTNNIVAQTPEEEEEIMGLGVPNRGNNNIEELVNVTKKIKLQVAFINEGENIIGNALTWKIIEKTMPEGFEIQRGTLSNTSNQVDWKSIGFISGIGIDEKTGTYSFKDKNLPNEMLYYRLKQIHPDGSSKYSNTVNVQITRSSETIVYPVSVDNHLVIQNVKGVGTIYSTSGSPLQTFKLTENISQVSLAGLPSGAYSLKVLKADGSKFERQFLKY